MSASPRSGEAEYLRSLLRGDREAVDRFLREEDARIRGAAANAERDAHLLAVKWKTVAVAFMLGAIIGLLLGCVIKP